MIPAEQKDDIAKRLRRAAGQVQGIERMVEEDRYCVDILLQVSAVRAALAKVGQRVLESHIRTCISAALQSEDADDAQAKIEELVQVLEKHCTC